MSHKKTDIETMLKMKLDLSRIQAQHIQEENDAGGITHRSEGEDYVPSPRIHRNPPPVIFKTRSLLEPKECKSDGDSELRKQVVQKWVEQFSNKQAPKHRRHTK